MNTYDFARRVDEGLLKNLAMLMFPADLKAEAITPIALTTTGIEFYDGALEAVGNYGLPTADVVHIDTDQFKKGEPLFMPGFNENTTKLCKSTANDWPAPTVGTQKFVAVGRLNEQYVAFLDTENGTRVRRSMLNQNYEGTLGFYRFSDYLIGPVGTDSSIMLVDIGPFGAYSYSGVTQEQLTPLELSGYDSTVDTLKTLHAVTHGKPTVLLQRVSPELWRIRMSVSAVRPFANLQIKTVEELFAEIEQSLMPPEPKPLTVEFVEPESLGVPP